MTQAVCSPPCSPGRYIHGLSALVLQRRKFTFSAKSPRFTQEIELSPSLSIPPETVCTGSLCPVHSIKRHSFQHEEGLWKTEHSSRQQINAGPECWRLESRQTWTKIRPSCWTVIRNIAAAELGTRGILSLQLCQGKVMLFLQRKQHPRVTSGIQL